MSPGRPAASGNVISVTSDGSYEEFSLGEAPIEPEPAPEAVTSDQDSSGKEVHCPSCGAANPEGNRHCQECGARLNQGPLPTAPRPAVQATAGVRAALAISGLLLIVVVIAVLFNVFSGDPVASGTTLPASSTTQPTVIDPAKIAILDVQCSQEGLGSFACENLIDGTDAEYQINWEEIELAEETVTIRLVFDRPMVVTRIDWSGVADPDRFRQNFRARGLSVDADGSLTEVLIELEDTPGLQTENYATLNANFVDITIQSAYQAEVVNGNVFRELAIAEIEIWGRPANPTTDDTSADG